MDGRMDGWMDGWVDGWMDGWIYPSLSDIINNHTSWVSEKNTEFGVKSLDLCDASIPISWFT